MTRLADGSRLGQYQIEAPLGAGGMGEVYRAYDTKLDRQVAIKILPPTLAGDPTSLARFEREAKAVAALSHPNILAIHDFGTDGQTAFAVMELLEGQTLRARLADGALPVRKAIDIAVQIARGLAAAHARDIVHRDLKPDNVFIAPNGHVKILDFGLAKAIAPNPSASETIAVTKEDTTPGMVVGTVGYMSPEQIRGAIIDQRSDIFAFGAVVYELLTGRRAFGRDSTAETMAAILKEDAPDLPAASGVPQPLERIVRRCLEKNPDERFYSAHDLGIALESLTDRSSSTTPQASQQDARWRPTRGVTAASMIAGLAIIALVATMWSGSGASPDASAGRVRKFHVPAQRLVPTRETRPVISPDGQKIVFAAGDSLWIQELDQLDPRQLATSWRPSRLFWSADSAFVGFVSEDKLWKVSVGGRQPIPLGDVARIGGGALGAWRPDGKIVFSRSAENSGLLELSQDGGEMRSVAALQEGDVDLHEPALLPDNNGYLLVVHRTEGPDTIAAVRGETRKEILRLAGEQLIFPQYSPTGHLIFGRVGKSTGIWAVPFDPAQLETAGEPFLIAAGGFFPSVSQDGTLTFIRRIWSEPQQLVIVNRAGAVDRAVGEPQPGLAWPVLAPDGRHVAVALGADRQSDVWIYDLERGGRTRLTFLESGAYPSAWTARNRVLYSYRTPGRLRMALAAQPADGAGQVEEFGEGFAASVSKNAAFTVFAGEGNNRDADIDLYYRGANDAAPKLFFNRAGTQGGPQLSPDSAYVAYHSNESGRDEVYVKPFPTGTAQWQVSFDGASDPRWSSRGDKLWFRGFGNVLLEVDITTGTTFAVSEPRTVFKGDPIAVDLTLGFDVLDDGQRFISARRMPDPDGSLPSITVVQNWFGEFANRR